MFFTSYSKQSMLNYILIFATSIKFSASQTHPAPPNCILNFRKNGSLENNNRKMGDWGGYIKNNCNRGAFKDYLYALGKRANQTGKIFLNETEQKTCLGTENDFSSNCGIENFRSGNGGCSDFSVKDVNFIMSRERENLRENCEFPSLAGVANGACSTCMRSWKNIRGIYNSGTNVSVENESYMCRFAVLITLTSSQIGDLKRVQNIYTCLEEQDSIEGFEVESVTENKKSHSDAKKYATIGGIIGTAAIILALIAYSIKKQSDSNFLPQNCAKLNCIVSDEYKLPKMSLDMIYAATNNLSESNFIGEGISGKVYKGMLPNKRRIAVKHIVNDKNAETFLREIKCLSQIRHRNLVSLLGYFENKDDLFLIYELCPNGDLSKWLFGENKALSWIQRLMIAIDSARGLRFLHTYPGKCIVHRDIKPTNILLGKNFRAKLSDFGLSKVIGTDEFSVISEVRGTFGYVDPDYMSDSTVNTSSDVYSFGIVLLQIISGKKVFDMNSKNPMPLHKLARLASKNGSITQFVDRKLEGEYSSKAFRLIFDVALSCTACKEKRPTMDKVVLALEEAFHISTKARAPTPYNTPCRFSTTSSSSSSSLSSPSSSKF